MSKKYQSNGKQKKGKRETHWWNCGH